MCWQICFKAGLLVVDSLPHDYSRCQLQWVAMRESAMPDFHLVFLIPNQPLDDGELRIST